MVLSKLQVIIIITVWMMRMACEVLVPFSSIMCYWKINYGWFVNKVFLQYIHRHYDVTKIAYIYRERERLFLGSSLPSFCVVLWIIWPRHHKVTCEMYIVQFECWFLHRPTPVRPYNQHWFLHRLTPEKQQHYIYVLVNELHTKVDETSAYETLGVVGTGLPSTSMGW